VNAIRRCRNVKAGLALPLWAGITRESTGSVKIGLGHRKAASNLQDGHLARPIFEFEAARIRFGRARCPSYVEWNSAQNVAHDVPVDVGQAEITTAESEGQLFVIQPQQVQYRGMQVVHRADVFDRVHPQFVSGSIN
jgi:hypothetical protein